MHTLFSTLLGSHKLAISILFIAVVAGCRTKFPPEFEKQADTEADRVFRASRDGGSVMFYTQINATNVPVGSGFFVIGQAKQLYIVTARHVFTNFNTTTKIRFRGPSDTYLERNFWELTTTNGLVIENKVSDALVILVDARRVRQDEFHYITVIGHTNLTSVPISELRGKEIWLTGFPEWHHPEKSFKAVNISTTIASELEGPKPNVPFDRYFLTSDPAAAGMSGGPVYQTPKNTFREVKGNRASALYESSPIGFISATFSDNTGGKFGVVIHISVVHEMIRDFENLLKTLPRSSNAQPQPPTKSLP